jgi:predicted double-glycine peptidase
MKFLCLAILVILCLAVESHAVLNGSDNPADFVLPTKYSCGAQSLYICARFHGVDVSLEKCGELVPISQEGASLLQLKKACEILGFSCKGYKADYDAIVSKIHLPAIAHLSKFNHYVVLTKVTPEEVSFVAPPTQVLTQRKEGFLEQWSGYILEITKAPTSNVHTKGLHIEEPLWKVFGASGEEYKHTFTVVNDSAREINLLSHTASCTCTSVLFSHNPIPSGGKGDIEVSVKGRYRKEGFRGYVSVHTDSLEKEERELNMTIEGTFEPVPGNLNCSPEKVYFGDFVKGVPIQHKIILSREDNLPLGNVELSCNLPFIEVTSNQIEDAYPQLKGATTILVTIKPDAPIGAFNGEITITTNHEVHKVRKAPVSGNVVDRFVAVPSNLLLVPQKSQELDKSFSIISMCNGIFNIAEITAEPKDALLSVQTHQETPSKWNVQALFNVKTQADSSEGLLLVKIAPTQEVVKVPFTIDSTLVENAIKE